MSLRAKIFLAGNAHVRNLKIHIINLSFFISPHVNLTNSDSFSPYSVAKLVTPGESGYFQDMTFGIIYVLE